MATKVTKEERKWFIVDAKGKVLGRIANKIAAVLRGKHKVTFTPHLDCGDCVVVINSKDIKLSGNKWADKMYYKHSGFPGGFKEQNAETVHKNDPTAIVRRAVYGMLPKNRLRKGMYARLKVYAENTHPHEAQNPSPLPLN